MKKVLLLAMLIQFVGVVDYAFGQSQTWNKILDPDNTNSQFKRHAYFSNGEGYTYQEYSNFKIFNVTSDGGKTWASKANPKGELLENLYEMFAPNNESWYALFAEAVKHRISIRAYNKSEDSWDHIATHSIPNQNLVLTSSEEVWMKAINSNMMFGSVKGMDKTSFEILHHPFILTNDGKDITMLRDKISDDFKWVRDIAFADDKHGLILVENSAKDDILYQTTDDGSSWIKVAELSTNDFSDIEMPDKDHYFIGMTDGKIYVTKDGGKNWSEIQTATTNTIYELTFATANCGVLVDRSSSSSYDIYRTTDGGTNWVKDEVNTDKNEIHSVSYIDCSTWFAITYGNIISNKNLPFGGSSSVAETELNWKIESFPNPANSSFTIKGEFDFYNVYNLQGQFVLGGTSNQIPTQSWPQGQYFLMLGKNGELQRLKLVVAH